MIETTCLAEERRRLVRDHPRFNGLDYLEVSDDQLTLTVYFLDKAPADLPPESIVVSGGRRVTGIRVTGVDVCRAEDPERDDCLSVTVDRPGDFSCYRLCIVELDERGRPTDRPRHDFDPRYACLDFSFKAGCQTELDCVPPRCPLERFPEPEINYLAKDYGSFRQLLLDRLALLVPEWRERHVPDLGVALVELLAYVGDHLSYHQDAVATEAYLDTARLRTSVRRHARLVDYRMHEGCNARAWVSIETNSSRTIDAAGLGFVTSLVGLLPIAPGPMLTPDQLERVPAQAYEWFEPVRPGPIALREAHAEIPLYTWGDTECCLPAGSTRATLADGFLAAPEPEPGPGAGHGAGHGRAAGSGSDDCDDEPPAAERERLLDLRAGDYLLLEEVLGPRTGVEADADPGHRHVVRLTAAEAGTDALTGQPVVEVQWAAADALPFALCISVVGPPPGCQLLTAVSVARGNVILVDHGRTVETDLPPVGTVEEYRPCVEGCPEDPVLVPERFRPTLDGAPLTFRAPIGGRRVPASEVVLQDARRAEPALTLRSTSSRGSRAQVAWPWAARPDLLASGPDDRHAVVEVDDAGAGHLRFGDGVLGRTPAAGETFTAVYRIGNGPAGNVGAEAVSHMVSPDPLDGLVVRVRNPLPARGGTAPEPVSDVKTFAPATFRRDRQRAVTAEDYAELAQRDAAGVVQRATAELRWTGSWYEVVVALDALGRVEADQSLRQQVRRGLERYRRISHDLRVMPAVDVALHVGLKACIADGHRRADVLAALLDRFGNRVLADGTLGLFHPDAVTFGDSVYVSRLVAEAVSVAGVENAVVTRLHRYGEPDNGERARGVLRLRPNEVGRLDNDPSFPDHGVLQIELGGGR